MGARYQGCGRSLPGGALPRRWWVSGLAPRRKLVVAPRSRLTAPAWRTVRVIGRRLNCAQVGTVLFRDDVVDGAGIRLTGDITGTDRPRNRGWSCHCTFAAPSRGCLRAAVGGALRCWLRAGDFTWNMP